MNRVFLSVLAVSLLGWGTAIAIEPTASSKDTISINIQKGENVIPAKESVGEQPLTAITVTKTEQSTQVPAAEPTTIKGAHPVIINTPGKPEPVDDRPLIAQRPGLLDNHNLPKISTIPPAADQRMILQGGDDFASATVIPTLPYTDSGSTAGYAHNYSLICMNTDGSPDVVYSYIPSTDGLLTVSLCGSSYDTGLGIYEDYITNPLACNDNFCGNSSEIDNAPILAGHTYYIIVTGNNGANGNYILSIPPSPPPSPGDNCSDPVVVNLPEALPYTNDNHTCGRDDDYRNTCLGYYDGGEDIIYRLIVSRDSCFNFMLDPGTTARSGMLLDDNCPPDPVSCIATSISQDAAPHGFYGINLAAGTYYVMIDTWPAPNCIGAFTLDISGCADAPANDQCANAEAIVGPYPVTIEGTTNGATVDCPGVLDWNAVWYTIEVPNGANVVSINFCPTAASIPAIGTAYFADCSCTSYQLFSYNWLPCPSGPYQPLLIADIDGPATIYFPVYLGANPMDFTFTVSVDPYEPPTPDFQVTAPGSWSDSTQNTCGALNDCSLRPSEDQIWEINIPQDSVWIFSLCNTSSSWDSHIYLGTNACMRDIGSNDDGCAPLSTITTRLTAGVYYLTVEGYSATSCGAYTLDVNPLRPPPPPPISYCDTITYVTLMDDIPIQIHGDTAGTSRDSICYTFSEYPSIWHAFVLPECMNLTIDLCGTHPKWGNAWLNLTLGCPCREFTQAGDFDITTCSDSNVTIRWDNLPADTYYYPIVVDTSQGAPSSYTMNVVGYLCSAAPPNDDCENATDGGVLTPGIPIRFTGNNSGATNDCPALDHPEVWIKFTLDTSQNVTISYCGTSSVFDNVFVVLLNQCCGSIVSRASWNHSCWDGNWMISFRELPPGQYWYPIFSDIGSEGPYVLTINSVAYPPPPCNYIVGDVNGNGIFNGLDVIYSVGYFKGGQAPPYDCVCANIDIWYVAGDVNASCSFNGLDVTYMVRYFKGGPVCQPCPACPPAGLLVPPAPGEDTTP